MVDQATMRQALVNQGQCTLHCPLSPSLRMLGVRVTCQEATQLPLKEGQHRVQSLAPSHLAFNFGKSCDVSCVSVNGKVLPIQLWEMEEHPAQSLAIHLAFKLGKQL